MTQLPLAYDIGANNGDDTAYYLAKGYRVIAIDANPELCAEITNRFPEQIESGSLKVVNVGVGDVTGTLDFYLDTHHHETSTFVPQPNTGGRYKVFPVDVLRVRDIIATYGQPDFFKIDVEGLDFIVLKDTFESGIYPPLLSAEAHSVEVLCLLIIYGYDQFKIMESSQVGEKFSHHLITTSDGGTSEFEFKLNSSGPFGEDYPTPWISKEASLQTLLSLDSTWRDVQAKNMRQLYLNEARQWPGVESPEKDVDQAYSYWRRYPDVARSPRYGMFGDLGLRGAKLHFEEHGQHEERRQWEE